MVNQARRGARAENLVRDRLGELGYDVIRSAASKGCADLVAIGDNTVILVQVKLGTHGRLDVYPAPTERAELRRVAGRVYGGLAVSVCVVPGAGARRTEMRWRLVTGPGPKDWTPWDPGTWANRGLTAEPEAVHSGDR